MEHPQTPKSLHEHLSIISDPRINLTKNHRLIDTLMVTDLAMLCRAEHFTDFEDFGRAKGDWLRTFLALPKGIPCHERERGRGETATPSITSTSEESSFRQNAETSRPGGPRYPEHTLHTQTACGSTG